MINEEISGPVNLTAPNPIRNSEFTRTLASVLRRPAILPIPAFVLSMLLGDMAHEMPLSSTRALPAKLVRSGFSFQDPELEDALARILQTSN
jgi:NAD dependent epimerase/dehydratase family enzyme